MAKKTNTSLDFHVKNVIKGSKKFENIFQSITRMILGKPENISKVTVNGKTTYDFKVFRQGKRHVVGMYDEINSFVSFVKDASEGGSSKEMAFVLIGEPGNGKTFFVDYLSKIYRNFISLPENMRYTFRFINLDKIGGYGKITYTESQTFEDPMILAMNLFSSEEDNRKYLYQLGAKEKQIDTFYKNYRPLGASSDYIYNQIKEYCDGDIKKIMDFIEITPIPISETRNINR